ncbi:MAG: dihydrofolate reductase [Bacteroidota bacterium]
MPGTIAIIVAIAQNNAIGKNNQLLWHIPEDLKRFKALTSGHTVIMGKKTYESLPIRPLPKRVNMVITDDPNEEIEGCLTVYSIEDALKNLDPDLENFVMGGGSVYKQFLPMADKLYLTLIDQAFDGDVFFPEINLRDWRCVEKEEMPFDETIGFSYSYLTYIRKTY